MLSCRDKERSNKGNKDEIGGGEGLVHVNFGLLRLSLLLHAVMVDFI